MLALIGVLRFTAFLLKNHKIGFNYIFMLIHQKISNRYNNLQLNKHKMLENKS